MEPIFNLTSFWAFYAHKKLRLCMKYRQCFYVGNTFLCWIRVWKEDFRFRCCWLADTIAYKKNLMLMLLVAHMRTLSERIDFTENVQLIFEYFWLLQQWLWEKLVVVAKGADVLLFDLVEANLHFSTTLFVKVNAKRARVYLESINEVDSY